MWNIFSNLIFWSLYFIIFRSLSRQEFVFQEFVFLGVCLSGVCLSGVCHGAEFKEFEPRLKFESRLKLGWFHLKLCSAFPNLSRCLIGTDFWRFFGLGLSFRPLLTSLLLRRIKNISSKLKSCHIVNYSKSLYKTHFVTLIFILMLNKRLFKQRLKISVFKICL